VLPGAGSEHPTAAGTSKGGPSDLSRTQAREPRISASATRLVKGISAEASASPPSSCVLARDYREGEPAAILR
jgi:hypothetical protein